MPQLKFLGDVARQDEAGRHCHAPNPQENAALPTRTEHTCVLWGLGCGPESAICQAEMTAKVPTPVATSAPSVSQIRDSR
jgi:hypothetical protein